MNILHKQEQYKQLLFSLISIVFFGFCLRMWGLGDQPLWTDEGHSWFKSTLPWSVIMDNMASKDVHPPFYYILLSLIGAQNNEINLRLPSVLFSIGSVGIVWFMGLISENLKTASIASLLIAISPLHIQYSQEVRHYAAFEFFSSLSCLGLLIFIKQWCDPFLNSRFRSDSDSDNYIFYKKAMLPACLVVFGTAASLWTSNTSVFLLLAINLTVLLIFLKVHSESRLIFLKIWFFYQALILIIWSFWVPSLIHQSNYDSWITDKGFDSLYNVVNDFWAYFIYSYRPFFTLFFITLVTLGISRTKNKNYAYALASLVVIPLISNLVVSYWSPILVTRSLIWVSLPLFVLIAIGLSSIKNKYFFYLSLIFGIYSP
jgi:mannosyltransferase